MLDKNGVLDFLNNEPQAIVAEFISRWRGVYYGMSLHIDGVCPRFKSLKNGNWDGKWITPVTYGGLPYQELFELYHLNRHPREAEETLHWRFSQYRPFTKAPFQQAIDTITGAIFQDSNYTVKLEDEIDNAYIQGNNFEGKDLVGYFEKKFTNICEDPNGVFVRIPSEPGYATTTDRIEPKLVFIPSIDIIRFEKEDVLFNAWDFVWHVNTFGYFRYKKDEQGNYYHFDEDYGGYYAHMLGYLPIDQAGGVWNTQGFYESWLDKAKPIADDFISSKSASQLVDKEASYPYITEVGVNCPECQGIGKRMYPVDKTDSRYPEFVGGMREAACDFCHGKGTISRNPAERLIVPIEDLQKSSSKLIQIENPDVSINKYHQDTLKQLKEDIYKALHLNVIEQAQSGVAKEKDMEARYQFFVKITNDIFDRLIRNTLRDIVSLRNVSVINGNLTPTQQYDQQITIIKPTDFNIKSSADLVNEYKDTTDAAMPDYIRSRKAIDYVDKEFSGDDVMKRKAYLIAQMDFLCVKSDSDKQAVVAGGGATQRDWQFSIHLPTILDKIAREKNTNWFVSAAYEEIEKLVDTEFDTIEPVMQATPPQTSIQVRDTV